MAEVVTPNTIPTVDPYKVNMAPSKIDPKTNQAYGTDAQGNTLAPAPIPTQYTTPKYDSVTSQTAKPVTTITSDTIPGKIADNTQTLNNQPATGLTTSADGAVQHASDGSYASAPSGAIQNEDGSYSYGGLRYMLPPDTGASPLEQSTNDAIANARATLDANTKAQVDAITKNYEAAIAQQKQINAGQEAGVNKLLIMGGSGHVASGEGILSTQMSYGLNQINDLQAKEAQAIANAKIAQANQDFALVDKQLTAAQKFNDDKQAAAKALDEKIATAAKNVQDLKQKQDQYNLDVQKFNETKDQNSFDNAFKAEQEQFSENQKTSVDAETARHNKAMEGIDAFKAGLGAGANTGVGSGITAATMGTNGAVDPVSQKNTYDQIAKTYGPMTAVAIKGLVDYSRLPTDWRPGASKGMTRDQAVSLAQMLDPTYTEAGAPARQSYMKSIASSAAGTIGGSVNSANKAINHLTSFVDEMSKLNNSPLSFINSARNALTIDPKRRETLRAAEVDRLGVSDELAKFFKGTGVTDMESIKAWRDQLSTAATSGDVQGTVQGAIDLLNGQLETLSEQYQSTMGKAHDTNFLGPSALANLSKLKDQGYKVDILGVYSTAERTGLLRSFHDASAENASLLDSLVASDPSLKTDSNKMIQLLKDNGIEL